MISSLLHKCLCGRDCSDPHSTDEETEAQSDDVIIHAQQYVALACAAQKLMRLQTVLRASTCLLWFLLPILPISHQGKPRLREVKEHTRGHPAGKSQDYNPTLYNISVCRLNPYCLSGSNVSFEKFQWLQNP